MTNLDALIGRLRALNPLLEERWGAQVVGVFGSVARGDDTPDSDLDLLMEFHRPIGLAFIHVAEFLESQCGRKVDLASAEYLRPWLRDAIRDELRHV